MYIEISQKFAESLDEAGVGPMWEIMSNIHLALRNGEHIIICENTSTAKYIVEKSSKRVDILSDFQNIEDEISRELRTLRSSIDRYYSLVPDEKTDFSQQGKCIKIGLDLALKDEFWKKSCLIIENNSDFCYYKMIADYEKSKKSNLVNINVNFDPISGGGVTSVNVFEAECKKIN